MNTVIVACKLRPWDGRQKLGPLQTCLKIWALGWRKSVWFWSFNTLASTQRWTTWNRALPNNNFQPHRFCLQKRNENRSLHCRHCIQLDVFYPWRTIHRTVTSSQSANGYGVIQLTMVQFIFHSLKSAVLFTFSAWFPSPHRNWHSSLTTDHYCRHQREADQEKAPKVTLIVLPTRGRNQWWWSSVVWAGVTQWRLFWQEIFEASAWLENDQKENPLFQLHLFLKWHPHCHFSHIGGVCLEQTQEYFSAGVKKEKKHNWKSDSIFPFSKYFCCVRPEKVLLKNCFVGPWETDNGSPFGCVDWGWGPNNRAMCCTWGVLC